MPNLVKVLGIQYVSNTERDGNKKKIPSLINSLANFLSVLLILLSAQLMNSIVSTKALLFLVCCIIVLALCPQSLLSIAIPCWPPGL